MSLRRGLLLGLKALGAALALALLALALVVGTAPGRHWLLGTALGVLEGSLPGRVRVERLERLSPYGVALSGVSVQDPLGSEVLRLGRVELELAPGELIGKRVVVRRLLIDGGFVDLHELERTDRGLLAAFVDPKAPPSPPSDAPPPYVRLDFLEVRGLEVRAPEIAPLGALTLRGLELGASFELDQRPRAALLHLRTELARGDAKLGAIEQLEGVLGRDAEPSELHLRARLVGVELTLAARGVPPPYAGWRTQPLSAELALRSVTAQGLALLLQNAALASAFSGEAALAARAQGTPLELELGAELASAAGLLSLSARLLELERVEAELAATSLEPWRLRPELPVHRVGFELHMQANAADRNRIPFSLQLSDASLDGQALPTLTLGARFEADTFRELTLTLAEAKSQLTARGEVSLEGALALDVDANLAPAQLERLGRLAPGAPRLSGSARAKLRLERTLGGHVRVRGGLSAERVLAPDVSLERLRVSVDVAGQPPALGGALELMLFNLESGGRRVPHAKVALHGGPERYRLSANAALADPALGNATLALALGLELAPNRLRLAGNASGELGGTPFALTLAPTELRAGGAATEGVTLHVAQQALRVRGALSEPNSELELEADGLELEPLGKLAALPEALHGTARLRGSVRGRIEAPHLVLALEGDGVSLGERPPIALRLSAELDAAAGHAQLDLDAKSEGPRAPSPATSSVSSVSSAPARTQTTALSLTLAAAHSFSGGRGWLGALQHGNAQARLRLAALDLAFAEAWLGQPLGASGSVQLTAEAKGTPAKPELTLHSELELQPRGQRAWLHVEPTLRYAEGRLDLDALVDDARGRWLDAKAQIDFGTIALPELAGDVLAALRAARWSLEASLAERELRDLPLAGSASLPPAALTASLHARAEPQNEPSAELDASLRQTEEYEGLSGCKASGVHTELAARLVRGAATLALTVASRERQLFEARANADVALKQALTGGGVALGRVGAELTAERLELASLPFLCRRVAGTLNSKITLSDALGERPALAGRIQASHLSLGATSGIELAATLRANPTELALDASLGTPAGTSTLAGHVPIAWSNGRLSVADDAAFELDARLRRLPIAPFLDPRGALSYASGSVSGELRARGTPSAPRASGELTLEDVAFTATNLAQPLRDIRGRVAFTEHSLEIRGFEAHDKDGTLKLDGAVDFASLERIGVRLQILAKRFPLRQEGQVVATSDVNANVETTITRERTRAIVHLREVDTWIERSSGLSGLALDAHPDFVIDGAAPASGTPSAQAANAADAPAPAPSAGASAAAPARITELTLDASDRFWVKRDDFAVKLSTKLEARIQGEDVRVTGRVDIDRGYLSLLGKVFTLERGSNLEFVGSEAPDPVVDITASHENRRSGATIKVKITGRGSKPELTFFINEVATTAGDAFLAIYGSQQSNERPAEASDQARQFVGGLAAGLLATTARRELGAAAPIIMVEPGQQTGQGRVRAGLELDSLVPEFMQGLITGVYFEGIVARESENPEQQPASVKGGALLELYFPRGFFSTGQYGPGSTWSLDWGWQL